MKMGASNMDDNILRRSFNEVIAMFDGPNQVQMKMGASNVYCIYPEEVSNEVYSNDDCVRATPLSSFPQVCRVD